MYSRILKKLAVTTLLGTSFVLTACETEEDNNLAKAQACLNDARSRSTAELCRTMVSGMESTSAYVIRCSADFIMQGFTTARFVQVAKELKDTSSGGDPVARMLGFMTFDDATEADRAVSDCSKTGQQGMHRFSMLAKTATTLASLSGQIAAVTENGLTPTDIQNIIDDLVSGASQSAANDQTIGELAVQLESVYCSGTSLNSMQQDVCGPIQDAITAGAGNSQTIGAQLLLLLQN